MRHLLILILLLAAPLSAQEAPQPIGPEILQAETHALDEFLWLSRPLVIFADSPRDPRFLQQMEYLETRPEDLAARDVVVILDTSPDTLSPIRETLRPRGFSMVLLGKDGQIYLRKSTPWHVREISRSIDKMPIRIQELNDSRQYTPPPK